jgi:hypothetical protein
MSRSFKKHPGCCDNDHNGGGKIAKNFAASKQRHYLDLPSGGAYKKVFNSWNIHDYNWRYWVRFSLMLYPNRQILRPWPCYKDLCKSKDYRKLKIK